MALTLPPAGGGDPPPTSLSGIAPQAATATNYKLM
jgi:hypothetical protein